MSRHQKHIRLLNHLARLGHMVEKVSNGQNTCVGRLIDINGRLYHQFAISKKFVYRAPPIVPLTRDISPSLVFTVVGKDGVRQLMLGWHHLAYFVQIEEEKLQKASRRNVS